jgi:hypothetical protein
MFSVMSVDRNGGEHHIYDTWGFCIALYDMACRADNIVYVEIRDGDGIVESMEK